MSTIIKNQPKFLTSKQRRTVDQIVGELGDRHTFAARKDIKAAAKKFLGTVTAPPWITRNMTVRIQGERGRYNLSVLLKLPVREEVPQEIPQAAAAAAKTPNTEKKKTPTSKVKEEKPSEEFQIPQAESILPEDPNDPDEDPAEDDEDFDEEVGEN